MIAVLCHTWAVTVTGAPKTWAIQFVEENERSPRCWYGGAVGLVGFDGSMNTGLTLRTVRVKNGVAEVRAVAVFLSKFCFYLINVLYLFVSLGKGWSNPSL